MGDDDDGAELDEEQVKTATAALFFHAIAIDGVVDDDEMARLRPLIRDHFGLEELDVTALIDEARQMEEQAVDIYRFTSVLRDRLSLDEKRGIIADMWRLVYADGELAALEDNLIWRTAELLAVPARDRMDLKKMVRDENE